MPFTKARPVKINSQKGQGVTVRVAKIANGERRLIITLGSKVAANVLGDKVPEKNKPTKIGLLIGRGSDDGLLAFDHDGDEIQVKTSMHGSVRMICEAWESLPDYSTTSHNAGRSHKDGKSCLILPKDWRPALKKSA